MTRPRSLLLLVAGAALLTGCATTFVGDAHFPGGARGCFDRCSAQQMEMGAFVYVGEYSSGCVCQPRKVPAGTAGGSAATAAAAAGVVMQMRQSQQQGGR